MNCAELVDRPELRHDIPAIDIAELFLARAAAVDASLNALVCFAPELARADARHVDELRRAGTPAPLDGMPIVVKDNIDVIGMKTQAGSAALRDRPSAACDAPVVAKLRRAGAIVIGKAGLHELALGASGENPISGAARNPWNTEQTAGGSSGGSAAAVAADLSIGALGTDTGGSVRMPAALTGVSGLRPTVGRVSTVGVHPVSWTFDTVGPIARHVSDLQALLTAMAAHPARPHRSVRRVGVPSFIAGAVSPGTARAFETALEVLVSRGRLTTPLVLSDVEATASAYQTLVSVEAQIANREQFESAPASLSRSTKERLARGRRASGAAYAEALLSMRSWTAQLTGVFDSDCDVVALPTVPHGAPKLDGVDNTAMTRDFTALTYLWSFARLPALSLPMGVDEEGRPVGLQLVARPSEDETLLQIGEEFQEDSQWHLQRPLVDTTTPASSALRRCSRT